MTGAELEEHVKAVLMNGVAVRRLFQLRQRRPDLAYELDQIATALKDAGDELLRRLAPDELPVRTDAA